MLVLPTNQVHSLDYQISLTPSNTTPQPNETIQINVNSQGTNAHHVALLSLSELDAKNPYLLCNYGSHFQAVSWNVGLLAQTDWQTPSYQAKQYLIANIRDENAQDLCSGAKDLAENLGFSCPNITLPGCNQGYLKIDVKESKPHFVKGISHAFEPQYANSPTLWPPFLRDQELSYLQQANVDYLLLHINGPAGWFNVAKKDPRDNGQDPVNWNNPYYDFRTLDSAVAKIQELGFTPVLNIWGTPIWANEINYDRTGNGVFDFMDYAPVPPNNLNQYGYYLKAVAERYNGSHPDINPLKFHEEEIVTAGPNYWKRLSRDSGISWEGKWTTGTLESLWGYTSNNPSSPAPPVTDIDTHSYRTVGNLIGETVGAGDRFWYRTSANGFDWSDWYTNTYQSAWQNTTNPPPFSDLDSHSFKRNNDGSVEERVIKGDYYWFRASSDGVSWPNSWYSNTLSSAWQTHENHPPLTNIDAQYFRNNGQVFTEAVVQDNKYWSREYSTVTSSWPSKWYSSAFGSRYIYESVSPPEDYQFNNSIYEINPPPQSIDTIAVKTYPVQAGDFALQVNNFAPWAEPNLDSFYHGSVQDFVTMSNFAYDQIKLVNPNAIVWGASCANVEPKDTTIDTLDWLEQAANLNYQMDVVGIRGYPLDSQLSPQEQPEYDNTFSPQDVYKLIQKIQSIPAYQNLPIIVTESGYMNVNCSSSYPECLTEDQQAEYLQQNLEQITAYYPRIAGWTHFLLYEYPDWNTGLVNKCSTVCDSYNMEKRPGYDILHSFSLFSNIANLKTSLKNYAQNTIEKDMNGDSVVNIIDYNYLLEKAAYKIF